MIRYSLARKIKIPIVNLEPGSILQGFAGSSKKSIGTKDVYVIINDQEFKFNVYVVSDSWCSDDFIIGRNRNFTNTVKIEVDHGKIKIINQHDMNFINVINVFEHSDELEQMCDHISSQVVRDEALHIIRNYNPKKETDIESPLDMKIIMADEAPLRQKARRLAPKERMDVNKQIDEWLHEGIIEYSNSDFASPIVVVKKKDGSNRIWVDYRKLNSRIKKDLQPMHIVDEILEKLASAKVFTTLDLKNGFFHVSVHKDSRKFTSFVTPDGQYQFCKVPFGLTNSPGVFQI